MLQLQTLQLHYKINTPKTTIHKLLKVPFGVQTSSSAMELFFIIHLVSMWCNFTVLAMVSHCFTDLQVVVTHQDICASKDKEADCKLVNMTVNNAGFTIHQKSALQLSIHTTFLLDLKVLLWITLSSNRIYVCKNTLQIPFKLNYIIDHTHFYHKEINVKVDEYVMLSNKLRLIRW